MTPKCFMLSDPLKVCFILSDPQKIISCEVTIIIFLTHVYCSTKLEIYRSTGFISFIKCQWCEKWKWTTLIDKLSANGIQVRVFFWFCFRLYDISTFRFEIFLRFYFQTIRSFWIHVSVSSSFSLRLQYLMFWNSCQSFFKIFLKTVREKCTFN